MSTTKIFVFLEAKTLDSDSSFTVSQIDTMFPVVRAKIFNGRHLDAFISEVWPVSFFVFVFVLKKKTQLKENKNIT